MTKGLKKLILREVMVLSFFSLYLVLNQMTNTYSQTQNYIVFGGFLLVLVLVILDYYQKKPLRTLTNNIKYYVIKGKNKINVELKRLSFNTLLPGYTYVHFTVNPNKEKHFGASLDSYSYSKKEHNGLDLFVNFDSQGRVTYVSDEMLTLFDITLNDIIDKHVLELNQYFGLDKTAYDTLIHEYHNHSAVEIKLSNKKKRLFWTFETVLDEHDNNVLIVAQGHEITQYFSDDKESLNHRDYLTGLLSQQGLYSVINHYHHVEKAAAFFIDITDFSKFNELFGHHVGDEILISIARLLEDIAGKEAIIARFSGDEFIVVCLNDSAKDEAVNKILSLLKAPLSSLINHPLVNVDIETKTGYATYPLDADNLENLIHLASLAFNRATPLDPVKKYSKDMKIHLTHEFKLSSLVHQAMREDSFEVHFQEVIDSTDGSVKYLESLARLEDFDYGYISPSDFLRIAKASNLIKKLDTYLIKKTLMKYKKLSANEKYKHTTLSLNVTPETLLDSEFTKMLNHLVESYHLKSSSISIEVAETTFVNNIEACINQIKSLKSYGYKIALDDFGKDYSSLAILETVPYDIIKLDAIFTHNIHTIHSQEIIRMVKNISVLTGKEMIIEGVETLEQKDRLIALGCVLHQGFYYHKPSNLTV
jgi:diguanylate cyclase (GGDEF)-like protein